MSEGRSNTKIALHPMAWMSRPPAPRVATLVLEDELDREALEQVGQELMRRLYAGTRRVVLDFSRVPHLDYRGVRSLCARVARLREAGGDVKLSGLSPYLATLLLAGGAYGVFELHATPEEAEGAFLPETPRAWR